MGNPNINPLRASSPTLTVKEIQDIFVRKNFESLQRYFNTENQLLGFLFYEFNFTKATANFKVNHSLGYIPRDIIVSHLTGSGAVQFNMGLFTETELDLTVTGALRLRFFVGTYWNYQSNLNVAEDEVLQFSNGATVPLSLIEKIASPSFLGRISSGTGFVEDLTVAQATSMLSAMGAASASAAGVKGLVPAPAAGDQTKFLRGDGTWDAAGSGSVTSVAMTVPAFLSVAGSPITTSGTLALTLSGTALPLLNGGTGQTTKSAAFDALSPMSASGDIIYGGTSGTGTKLAKGSDGQVLTLASGLPSWATPTVGTVTSVAITVPSFLSVSGSPITSSGTFAVTLSGTALPIANGGTGQTTKSAAFDALSPMSASGDIIYGGASGTGTRLAKGSDTQVLTLAAGVPTWATPTTGTVTSVAMTVPAFLSVAGSPITSSGTLAVTLSGTALPLLNGGTGQTTKAAAFDALSPMSASGDIIYGGASGTGTRLAKGSDTQVLTLASGLPTWATPTTGTVTSVAMTVPTFLSVSGSPITTSGTLAVTLSGTALPLLNGGTGQTTKAAAYDALSPMSALGDITYGGASGTGTRLAGNTTSTNKFLAQTGTGSVSAAPGWVTILAADVPTLNQNTTGTASNVTGTVAIGNGGTGQTTKAAAFDALSPLSTLGDVLYGGASGTGTRLAGNTTSTNKFLVQTGTGSVSAAPSWATIAGGDLPNPSSSTKGGVQSAAAVSHQWINSISTSGVPALSQPAFTDISGSVAAAQMPALTGDVTTSAGAVATTIATNAVTLAKMAQVATATFLGRTTAATGNVEALTVTQATALLNVAVAAGVKGLVPSSVAGDATKFLRGDITWATPSAGSGSFNYAAKTANYTAVAQDYVNCTSGTFTVTLPTAASISGQAIKIKNSGTGVITINTTSSQTIDGIASGTIKLSNQYEWIQVTSDGANWIIDNFRYRPSRASFSNATSSGTLSIASSNAVRINETVSTSGGADITTSQDATDGCKFTFTQPGWATVTWGVDNFNGANLSYMRLNGSGRFESNYAGTVGSTINSRGTFTIRFKVATNDYFQILTTGSSVDTVSGVGHIVAILDKEF